MFSYTGNQWEWAKIQYDKPFYYKSKLAAKMAAPNGKMTISLLLFNLEQQNLALN